MTKPEGMTNREMRNDRAVASSSSLLRLSFDIRRTAFGIFSGLVLTLMAIVTEAQSPNVIGTWNVEITFANSEHRSLRFDAQPEGKGTLTVTDPRAKVWSGAKPAEAKWNPGEGNSVTFSGPVEFLLGNVGRDAGILTCKGTFETADLISGEAEFSPVAGERLSKHGSFKAVRTKGI
jgi:hypothetical protein